MKFSLLIAVTRCRTKKENFAFFSSFLKRIYFLRKCLLLLFFPPFKGSTLRRRSLRLFLVKSYPREKYFHRDINNLASCKRVKIVKNVGERRSSRLFFFLLEKLSLRKKDLFDRKRELDLKGTEKKKEKGKEHNEEIKKKVIFFQRKRIVLIYSALSTTLEHPYRIKSVFHLEDHFRSILERNLGNFGRQFSLQWGKLKRQDGSTNSRTFPICLPRAAGMYTSIMARTVHRGKPIVQ